VPQVEVETEALLALGRQVLQAAGAARWAAGALTGANSARSLEECADLCRHVLTLLTTSLETVAERLSAAAAAYESADWLAHISHE
jgi:hypothetical protein